MSKQVVYNPQARLRMIDGINQVANAAKRTLGNTGPAVMIQHQTDGIMPIFTRDGVTVANAVIVEDRIGNLGARMMRDVAGTVSRQVGDGTTTAIVLAQKIANESLKSVAAGFHPLELRKGLEIAFTLVEKYLKEKALTDIDREWIEKITNVATKGELGVGALLADALEILGIEGTLNFQLGNSCKDVLKIVDGLHYEQGYLSEYFVTDKIRSEAILDRPYILFYDREISDLMDLIPILEEVKAEGRSLLIVAEDVIDKALTGLLLNHVRGIFKVVAVKPPGFGDKRVNRLKDLALLTGGEAILEATAVKLSHLSLDQLGQAERVVVNGESTTIIGGKGTEKTIKLTIKALRRDLKVIRDRKPGTGSITGNQHDAEELEDRIAILTGKTGVFEVGGVTDIEIKERLVRIENAYMSSKAALEEGVFAGGGIGLMGAKSVLEKVIAENSEQQQGIRIMGMALTAPFEQLAYNAKLSADMIYEALALNENPDVCFDMQTQQYGNFLEIGIIDPVKITRLALKSAMSVVSTLITFETVIMEVPDLSIMAGYSPEWAAATREDPRID